MTRAAPRGGQATSRRCDRPPEHGLFGRIEIGPVGGRDSNGHPPRALVENVEYLRTLTTPNLLVWVVRGFGTAVMHGAATAIFAVLSKSLVDRRERPEAFDFVPGFVVAVAIHSALSSTGSLSAGWPAGLLVCATEKRSEDQMQKFADTLDRVLSTHRKAS